MLFNASKHLNMKWTRSLLALSARSAALGCAACLAGCLIPPDKLRDMAANSTLVTKQLQTASAGHTGCLPDDNHLTIISAQADGSGVWRAVCKDKTYLCSAVGSPSGSASYSCAPQVE